MVGSLLFQASPYFVPGRAQLRELPTLRSFREEINQVRLDAQSDGRRSGTGAAHRYAQMPAHPQKLAFFTLPGLPTGIQSR